MKKSSLINRFFGKVKTALSAAEDDQVPAAETEPKSTGFDANEPLDLNFAKQFTQTGGGFIYCSDENDVKNALSQLIQENNWDRCFCNQSPLQDYLEQIQVPYRNTELKLADVIFSDCEYLIAFNGSIMISSKQSANKKIDILPESHIVLARTSQIVKNLSEGLRGINLKYKTNIPSLITTIRNECEQNKQTHSGPKHIYVLLIEDYSDYR